MHLLYSVITGLTRRVIKRGVEPMEVSIKELLEFLKALEKNDTYEVEKVSIVIKKKQTQKPKQ